MRASLFILLALLAGRGDAADSVVLGKGLSNEFVALPACPDGAICMNSSFRWEIDVRNTVAGPMIKGRVRAMAAQHAEALPSFVRSVEVFVLRPILDDSLRQQCGADFELVTLSPRYEGGMYCLLENPSQLGLSVPESEVSFEADTGSYCFASKLIRR